MAEESNAKLTVLRRKTPEQLKALWETRATMPGDTLGALEQVMKENGIVAGKPEAAPTAGDSSATEQAAGPQLWKVRLANGMLVHDLTDEELGAGVKDGWLTLEDNAAKGGKTEFDKIRTVASDVFGVGVYLDTPKAYATIGAGYGAMIFAALGLLAAPVSLANGFEISVVAGFGVLLVAIITFGVMAASGNFIVTGIVALIGGAVINTLTGRSMSLMQTAGFILGFVLGLVISVGLIALVGAGLGWLSGRVVGMTRRGKYVPPSGGAAVPAAIAARAPSDAA